MHDLQSSSSSSALRGRATAVMHARTVVLSVYEAPLPERRFPVHALPSRLLHYGFRAARHVFAKCQGSEPTVSRMFQDRTTRFAVSGPCLRRRIDRQARSCCPATSSHMYSWWCCPCCLGGQSRKGCHTSIRAGSGQRRSRIGLGSRVGCFDRSFRKYHIHSSEVTESALSFRAV